MTEIERQILNNQHGIMLTMASVILKLLPLDCTKLKDEDALDILFDGIHSTSDLLAEDEEEKRQAEIRERMKNRE